MLRGKVIVLSFSLIWILLYSYCEIYDSIRFTPPPTESTCWPEFLSIRDHDGCCNGLLYWEGAIVVSTMMNELNRQWRSHDWGVQKIPKVRAEESSKTSPSPTPFPYLSRTKISNPPQGSILNHTCIHFINMHYLEPSQKETLMRFRIALLSRILTFTSATPTPCASAT